MLWSYYKARKWNDRYKQFPSAFEGNTTSNRLDFDRLLSDVTTAPAGLGKKNLSEEIEFSNLKDLVQSPRCVDDPFDFLEVDGGRKFFNEAIIPGIRERFFTNGYDFNMLELYLGYEDENPTFVEGGNIRVIERLLKLSGATIKTNTEVRKIEQLDADSGERRIQLSFSGRDSKQEQFDDVIIATSLDRSNLTFMPDVSELPGLRQDYRDSVVTLFTTAARLNPAFFNWTDTMPQNILTTEKCIDGSCDRPPFFSLTFLKEVFSPANDVEESRLENLYKIVSTEEIPDTSIEKYLMPMEDDDFAPVISWIYRENLPKSVAVASDSFRDLLEEIEILPNVYYAGGGEQVIASAEFACRMGANAANSILNGYAPDRP